MDSLTFLNKAGKGKVSPLYVVHGDDLFLKRLVLKKLRQLVLGEDDFGFSEHAGDKTSYATVMDELQTIPFFGSQRLVMVRDADPFVSKYRKLLEKVVDELPEDATLVLEVKTWSTNTKLAKKVDASCTLVCKAPGPKSLGPWCVERAKTEHNKQLTANAAKLLVELVGAELGLLDQELEKLSVYVGSRTRINEEDVDKLVGRNQAENIWLIFQAIGSGRTREALGIIQRLFEQQEEPIRLVGALTFHFRKLIVAGRKAMQGTPIATALAEAGVRDVAGGQRQLKHLGPKRVSQLYDSLLQLSLDLRGDSLLSPQILVEQFIIQLCRPRQE
ncbi:MAG: DNA polymerase III subunit delta [Gemmataceae bacterium]